MIELPNTNRWSIGGDPELFALDASGHIPPLHKHDEEIAGLNTSRYKPRWYRDGCAVEYQVMPTPCRGIFIKNISQHNIGPITAWARKHGYSLAAQAEASILKASLKDAPKEMLSGGCDPDYDAYSGMMKTPFAYKSSKRYAGGHIHIGMSQWGLRKNTRNEMELAEIYADAARLMDIWVAIPLVAILGAEQAASERARRKYYGQAGSFRVQPHGMEYRTLSASAYKDPALISGLLGMMRIVVNTYFHNIDEDLNFRDVRGRKAAVRALQLLDDAEVQRIINEHDYHTAQAFCMEVLYPSVGYMRRAIVPGETYTKDFHIIATAMAAWTVGAMHNHFIPQNLVANWAFPITDGPASRLAKQKSWPFYQYVPEFVSLEPKGSTYDPTPRAQRYQDLRGIADLAPQPPFMEEDQER